MRLLLVLLLVAMATPAAAASFEDLYGWLFAGNDRSASKPRSVAPTADAALGTSFLADEVAAYVPGELDRLPQIPDGGIPLETPPSPVALDPTQGRRVGHPVPEPTGALLFAVGAFAIAHRTRRRAA